MYKDGYFAFKYLWGLFSLLVSIKVLLPSEKMNESYVLSAPVLSYCRAVHEQNGATATALAFLAASISALGAVSTPSAALVFMVTKVLSKLWCIWSRLSAQKL